MNTSPVHQSLPETAVIGDDEYVLPEHLTAGMPQRGPRFGDTVWDLRVVLPRTARASRIDFTTLAGDTAIRTAKEYLYSRLRRAIHAGRYGGFGAKPLKATGAVNEFRTLRSVLETLRALGIQRLSDVRQADLNTALIEWKQRPHAATRYITVLRYLAAHGPFLTQDRLSIDPWLGRPAAAIAGKQRSQENTTARIPEPIAGPFMKAAVFYVEVASHDILAARREVRALEDARRGRVLGRGEARARITAFVARRRAEGRGIPALPLRNTRRQPEIPIVDGVVQEPNRRLVALLSGAHTSERIQALITEAGRELGYEPGGLDTPMSAWPDTGQPWRPRLAPGSVEEEIGYLRAACWATIAFLSGMRDDEVRELRRDCAFTERGQDGRIRYKVRGRVYKHRQLSGDEAEWVVLEIVHRAIAILLDINDDPTHLFGRFEPEHSGYILFGDVPARLVRFRDHLNELFGGKDGLFIPNDATTSDADTEDPPDDGDDEGQPWAFNTRQFRRTLAWYIAHQPFGVVAGAKQYQHAKTAIFEGYAGSSESGFAAEVAANEAVARLDYLEDLYRDWDHGGRAGGGAAKRIDAEFARIRRELGDLPGVVASPARLQTMLAHLTKTLHPGVLNDCFYQPATAVCRQRAKTLGRPLPLHNMCMACPNARRSARHLPQLTIARDHAAAALQTATGRKSHPELPPLQRLALTSHITDLDRLIAEVRDQEDPQSA